MVDNNYAKSFDPEYLSDPIFSREIHHLMMKDRDDDTKVFKDILSRITFYGDLKSMTTYSFNITHLEDAPKVV